MKHSIATIILILCIVSCNNRSRHWETLMQVETFIEERPDSALAVLEQINKEELSSKEEKAKHALLLSIALDKNYIDLTDFEILQPAIDYYKNNGSPTEKLRTKYYQGRICQNSGNDATAMTCFIEAIDNGKESDDILTKARLYVAQGNIYYRLMKWDNVCETNIIAAEHFHKANRIDSYVNCLLKAINGEIQRNDNENARKYLIECQNYLESISDKLVGKYYSAYLTYLIRSNGDNYISTTIEKYLQTVPDNYIDYITLSMAYSFIGEYDKAIEAISKERFTKRQDNKKRYYAVLADIFKQQKDYENALKNYLKFYALHDSAVFTIFEQDTQFIEERHALEVQNIRENESKKRIILSSIILVIIFITVIIYIKEKLKYQTIQHKHAEQKAEHYRLLYHQMECEKENLTELLIKNRDINNQIKDVITQRIELLNKFFTAYITNNYEIERNADKELDDLLANKDLFMSSTRLAFEGCYPKFIEYLKHHNLTEREIEYCCLYALGLKGKDLGSYIKIKGHYNISSNIREKLGLTESDTNLSIYIRKLLKTT